jgi:hypothetical protein
MAATLFKFSSYDKDMSSAAGAAGPEQLDRWAAGPGPLGWTAGRTERLDRIMSHYFGESLPLYRHPGRHRRDNLNLKSAGPSESVGVFGSEPLLQWRYP